ncbi:MAG: hypothetical protein Rhob2KO_44620 [Rhodopirellula baltica]
MSAAIDRPGVDEPAGVTGWCPGQLRQRHLTAKERQNLGWAGPADIDWANRSMQNDRKPDPIDRPAKVPCPKAD